MNTFLTFLVTHAKKHPWRIVGFWTALLVLLGGIAYQQYVPPTSAISIPGTQAQVALTKMNDLFPDAGKGMARIVYEAPEGKTVNTYQKEITDLTTKLNSIDGVEGAIDPFLNVDAVSENKRIGYTTVQLTEGFGNVGDKTREEVMLAVEAFRQSGIVAEVGGDVIDAQPEELLGVGEVIGLGIALIVLLVTLGSLVAAGLPLVIAIVSVAVSMAGLFALSQTIDILSTTPVLAVMLGLAVGIDYSLFIVNKYRHYLLEGASHEVALKKANLTAGNAVLFAAGTVVIALAALSVVNIPFMTTMGLAGAATIALTAVVSVSLVPALIHISRERIFIGKTRKMIEKAQETGFKHVTTAKKSRVWYRWAESMKRHTGVYIIASLAFVGVMAWPAQYIELGIPTDKYSPIESTEKKAYDLMTRGFGEGYNTPLAVVVDNLPKVTESEREKVKNDLLAKLNAEVQKKQKEAEVEFRKKAANIASQEQYAALMQEAQTAQAQGKAQIEQAKAQILSSYGEIAKRINLAKAAEAIEKESGVSRAVAGLATESGSSGVIQVIPTTGDKNQISDVISTLRADDIKSKTGFKDASYATTGTVALQNDVNKKLADALPVYLAVIVGLSFILLTIAFRSLFIPVKATLGFLLSVAVMFGSVVAVFQWGWFGIAEVPAPIVSFIPIIAVGILFGLAMDYEFFLVSSMRESYEESKTKDPTAAVVNGFGIGTKVVTAAAVIMTAIFGSFITSHDTIIQTIGFGLGIGILVDAFIVRMILTPCIMMLAGKASWWLPKWLDSVLPHIDIEGSEGHSK